MNDADGESLLEDSLRPTSCQTGVCGMIHENQQLLSKVNILSDAALSYLMLPLAFWLRFSVLHDGVVAVPLANYLRMGVPFVLLQLLTNAAFGLYRTSRKTQTRDEMAALLRGGMIDSLILLSLLFVGHNEHYSRGTLGLYVFLSTGIMMCKHFALRKLLRALRRSGKNLKHIILVGSGEAARKYLLELQRDRDLGYVAIGYIARHSGKMFDIPYLGSYEALDKVLERYNPDEVVSAIDMSDYKYTPVIIESCEARGVKLAIIPFYAEYMPAKPQFDELNGIPLMNIRRIPLDNFANAFVKRAIDIVGSLVLIVLLSPLMLICAIGVKISSPGPILFRQERIGKDKKPFNMYKFRSMRVNETQDSAWSKADDTRRTAFGAFIRKYSLDELPQFFCVLSGTMSLVGPRPEIPHFVDQFKSEIHLYMVRHEVRPGITGWAQIHGFRGDTPIKERVEHDIFYIENWSVWLDIQILLSTIFNGKFINDERLG